MYWSKTQWSRIPVQIISVSISIKLPWIWTVGYDIGAAIEVMQQYTFSNSSHSYMEGNLILNKTQFTIVRQYEWYIKYICCIANLLLPWYTSDWLRLVSSVSYVTYLRRNEGGTLNTLSSMRLINSSGSFSSRLKPFTIPRSSSNFLNLCIASFTTNPFLYNTLYRT